MGILWLAIGSGGGISRWDTLFYKIYFVVFLMADAKAGLWFAMEFIW